MPRPIALNKAAGFLLIEVLVTIFILAFGLLGLAGMQVRIQMAEMESYQRTQALVLASDMAERMIANRSQAASFVTAEPLGKNDSYSTCASETVGTVNRDKCEWSLSLKGSAEVSASSTNVGAMIDGRGCITQVTAPNTTTGVCQPGVYRIDVVWQGLNPTSAPSVSCGSGQYGADDSNRRAVSRVVTIGLPSCGI